MNLFFTKILSTKCELIDYRDLSSRLDSVFSSQNFLANWKRKCEDRNFENLVSLIYFGI